MKPFDPILDQPQSIDYDAIDPAATLRLGNQELVFTVDSRTDLADLTWPWADALYARSIKLTVRDPQHDELVPLVTRYFPGYQETILGSEGMIISKQLAVPFGSADDRAVIWRLECQAEGDRLVRLDVEIDWGEPLTQRIVDGLLVAQRNPGAARGLYAQHSAESTRIFGNPHGRPSALALHPDGRAQLTYFVLINGHVEVPLLLTLSDVGEQVAWSSFLALRDAERAFELSVAAWDKALKTGRLWTPDPRLNRAVQAGRLAALRGVQRLRTGLAPSDRDVLHTPALVKALDGVDPVQSRNLLAHLRRVAERNGGRLPPRLPLRVKDELEPAGSRLAWHNNAYLAALHEHLLRHPDAELLAEHYPAVQLCAEQLMTMRENAAQQADGPVFAAASVALRHAVVLATERRDSDGMARWESEACELEREADAAAPRGLPPVAAAEVPPTNWLARSGWRFSADRPWHFDDPWAGVVLAGDAVWQGCGLQRRRGKLAVYPKRGAGWRWWALLDLPLDGDKISLVWDGATLHSTQPVQSDQPVQVHATIRPRNTDELDFDLTFEFTPPDAAPSGLPHPRPEGARANRRTFHPDFDKSA
jgi:hypothetical protein